MVKQARLGDVVSLGCVASYTKPSHVLLAYIRGDIEAFLSSGRAGAYRAAPMQDKVVLAKSDAPQCLTG
jgi:hypothetical protein